MNELKQTEEECVVYLCGTKVDLVEENKKLRKVEQTHIREYADGRPHSNTHTHV